MTWTVFLLQGSIYLLILFATYWFLLRQMTFFQFNRWVLLAILILSCLLPLLPAPSLISGLSFERLPVADVLDIAEVSKNNSSAAPGSITTPVPAPSAYPIITQTPAQPGLNRGRLIWWIYLAGVLVLSGRFIFQATGLMMLLLRANWTRSGRYYLAFTEQSIPPFSFFQFILLNDSLYAPETTEKIICHEKIHSDQLHSLDILIAEMYAILFWFHPLSWLLVKAVRLNLEFIADQEVLQQGEEPKAYQYSLLEVGTKGRRHRLINHFNHSIIKNRIIMMNARKSPEGARLRYLLLLPFVFILFSFFNVAYNQKAAPKPDIKVESGEKPAAVMAPKADARAAQAVGTTSATEGVNVAASPEAPATAASPAIAEGVTVSGSGSNTSATAVTTNSGVGSSGSGATVSGVNVVTAQPASGVSADDNYETAKIVPSPSATRGRNIYLVIRAELDEATLKGYRDKLRENGVEMTIPRLKYNAQGLITSIEIKINAGSTFHADTSSSNDNNPIEEPVVFYRLLDANGRYSYGLGTGVTDSMPQEIRKMVESGSFSGLGVGTFSVD